MESELYQAAIEARRADDLELAAERYAALAGYELVSSDYDVATKAYREGAAYAVTSVSLDARAGNPDRARRTAGLFGAAIDRVAAEADDQVVRGLGHEWRGDVELFCGDAGAALEAYERARETFADLSLEAQLHWGARPEYDQSLIAAEPFFEELGVEYFAEHDVDFAGRVAWKIAVVDEEST